ncbi:hypothetical protein [Maricaulis maris]|uniref:hypothetical protein n=1 Tax=Maricaulis maris TaxID=74318 RepID=UPI003BAC7572
MSAHPRLRTAGEAPDPSFGDGPTTGRRCLGAAAIALNSGDDAAAQKLLGLARDFIALSRADIAMAREQLRLTAETEVAKRDAQVAWYNAAGLSVEEIELDMQIREDAERIRHAREAGHTEPEPRWPESWELVEGGRDGPTDGH